MKFSMSRYRIPFMRNAFVAVLMAGAGYSVGAGAPAMPRVPDLARTLPTAGTADSSQPVCTSLMPLSLLTLSRPDGQRAELAHYPGCGWKYVQRKFGGTAGLRAASFPASAAKSVRIEPTAQGPMSVFIDGPTGYAFGWTRERGWTFVGQIAPATGY